TVPFADPKLTTLSYDAVADNTTWDKVVAVLPDVILKEKTMDWLRKNIRSAKVQSVRSEGRGTAAAYRDTGSTEGYFLIEAGVAAVNLEFLKKWPLLEDCAGAFTMRNLMIDIDDIACRSLGVGVGAGSVTFPDLGAKPPLIAIEFEAKAPFKESLAYLQAGPLASIAQVLKTLGVSAEKQTTQISISAPLSKGEGKKNKLKLTGATTVTQASLATPLDLYAGSTPQILVNYDQDGIIKLEGKLKGPYELSQLTITRDRAKNGLAILVAPIDPTQDSLHASAFATPSNAPKLIRGSATGLQLKNRSARGAIDDLNWRLGEDSLLSVKGSADIADFGTASKVFGIPGVFKGGKGTTQFDLS
ncbi:MAG: hypothetical protein EOP10_34220, partial [Proteobacteria bacterium]